jgi:hypothetical protein
MRLETPVHARDSLHAAAPGVDRLLRSRNFWILTSLLLGDLASIQLHRFHLQGLLDERFSIEMERSLPEYYQHAKELLALVLAGMLWWGRRDALYLCWTALFTYLLADDAFQIHETAGRVLAGRWAGNDLAFPEAQSVAELIVSGAVGLMFFTAVLRSWRPSSDDGRRLTVQLLLALMVLGLFGVVVDALHSMVTSTPWHYRLGIVEDGGELLAFTGIAWLLLEHFARIRPARSSS